MPGECWKTKDGRMFDTRKEALEHEKRVKEFEKGQKEMLEASEKEWKRYLAKTRKEQKAYIKRMK